MLNLIVFGTGSVAYDLLQQIDILKVNIVAFVNSNSDIKEFCGYPVIIESEINNYEYDYVLIASGYVEKMKRIMLDCGVNEKKIIASIFDDISMYETFNKHLNEYIDRELGRDKVKRMLKYDRRLPDFYLSTMWNGNHFLSRVKKDFVREETTYLLAKEIERRNLKGDVAEIGVYKGDFTIILDEVYKERDFWLYDTFDGFGDVDIKGDELVNNKENELLKFKDTSPEYVLSRLKKPERTHIVKGFFPDSFKQDKVSFCFVSIDLNLYSPVKQAIDIFYKHLVPFGYIIVSDYEAPFYEGSRKAVQDWCEENNKTFTPLPDLYGSVIIQKVL